MISIFIKKPIYTTYYDNKVYFIDKESSDTTLLKVYDSVYLTFENHYLDLSGYDSFLTVVSLNENLFAIATIEDKTILLKINLTTFDINELEIDLLTNDYNGIYVTTIEYKEKENYLIALTPSDTSNNSNPLIVMVSKDSFELISCSVLQFDSTEESKVSSIKQNLMKMFAFPAGTCRSSAPNFLCISTYFLGNSRRIFVKYSGTAFKGTTYGKFLFNISSVSQS